MTAIDLRDSVAALSPSASPSFLAVYRPGRNGGQPSLELLAEAANASIARDERLTVVFAGELFEAETRLPGGPPGRPAESVLRAFKEHGDEALKRIRGAFALAVHDARDDSLLFARDQLGHQPFFFAEGSDGLYLSESIPTLVGQDAVSSEINRPFVAELLIHRTRSPDETGFEAVNRVRSGWAYKAGADGISAARYWFPVEPKGGSEWVTEAELPEFEPLMSQAVERAVLPGSTAIFLSGGLDSVTVATYATDLLAAQGKAPPLGLSLVFPGFDESAVQTIVAQGLGMRHELIPFEDASQEEGLVLSAVRTSGTWPMPLVNLWQPLYTHLALLGKANGARRILTGAGGDEWLQVSPQWGFSRLRRLHVREMQHLYRTYLQSYNLKRGPLLKNLLWKYGLYFTLRNAALKTLDFAAPGQGAALKVKRFRQYRPAWLAPDPELSAEIERRAGLLRPVEAPGVRFAQDNFPFLENAIGAMEREEAFERSKRLGVETYMPFWDADLDEFLARVPPHLMNQGYWSKGLVRGKLAERFPAAGFDQQLKVLSTTLSTKIMASETPGAWSAMDGVRALAEVGIVQKNLLQLDVERRVNVIKRPEGVESQETYERAIAAHGIWTVLNVESWLRQWC
jgi:asparagine synthetase B (glutamine-hydrolysing)